MSCVLLLDLGTSPGAGDRALSLQLLCVLTPLVLLVWRAPSSRTAGERLLWRYRGLRSLAFSDPLEPECVLWLGNQFVRDPGPSVKASAGDRASRPRTAFPLCSMISLPLETVPRQSEVGRKWQSRTHEAGTLAICLAEAPTWQLWLRAGRLQDECQGGPPRVLRQSSSSARAEAGFGAQAHDR